MEDFFEIMDQFAVIFFITALLAIAIFPNKQHQNDSTGNK